MATTGRRYPVDPGVIRDAITRRDATRDPGRAGTNMTPRDRPLTSQLARAAGGVSARGEVVGHPDDQRDQTAPERAGKGSEVIKHEP